MTNNEKKETKEKAKVLIGDITYDPKISHYPFYIHLSMTEFIVVLTSNN